jgi:[protein-PII] uridylyltransferase
MRSYYIHARNIARLSRRVIDDERNSERLRRPSAERGSYSLAEGFALVYGRLQIPSASLLEERPVRLLSVFAIAQHHDVELSARAQRLVHQHLHLVDDAFRKDPEAATLFRQLLQSPTRVYRSLAVMDELGLLGAYLPELGRLAGLWQQDMYHTYTVDVHSLFLVEQLRRLRKGNFREELPFPTALVREVQAPEIIYLGCMLHDIGKGLGGGHSERGAAMVPGIAQRLGLSEDEQDLVEFVVREHLTMSEMAERRDVHDSRAILNLANLCGSRERLRSLYLATIADIRSVSPEAWTTWKGGLLETLYRNAAEWLEAGGEAPDATRAYLERAMTRADEARRDVADRLVEDGASRPRVESFLDVVPPRFFLDHNPGQLRSQLRSALAFVDSDDLVGVYPFHPDHDEPEFWGICAIAHDRPGLFSQVTGVLTACGHNILAAHVYTTRSDLAIEIYQLDPIAGGPEEEELEVKRIETRLRRLLSGVRDVGTHTARPSARRPRSLRAQPPSVRIANQDSDFYTIIDVSTNDRPALLFDITRALSDLGLEIVMSRAATRANRVTDAFYVTDAGHKVADPERQREIEASVLQAIQQDRV